VGALSCNASTATSATTATNATNTAVTDDTTTNATYYPTFVSNTTGNLPITVSSTKLKYNPSTGALTANQLIIAP
jgi:predicted dinucleotide-utilizing enzyme